jgi:hypothetical protein
VIDHLCHNRRCGKIDHLVLRSRRENAGRTVLSQRSHCKRGHEFTEENTYRRSPTRRECRACIKMLDVR